MREQLLFGTVMILITVIFHISCLVLLANMLKRMTIALKNVHVRISNLSTLVFSVIYIIGIHTVEAWTWAIVYLQMGEFDSLIRALYFSVVTLTTLGYGDITLSESAQLLGTFEAMGGLILFGASTAFLLASMRHLFEDHNKLYGHHRDDHDHMDG
ncbi:MAG: potassium channel family protein [Pseudomonadota bacterium]